MAETPRDESYDSIDPQTGALSGAALARRRQMCDEVGFPQGTPWHIVLTSWEKKQALAAPKPIPLSVNQDPGEAPTVAAPIPKLF